MAARCVIGQDGVTASVEVNISGRGLLVSLM